MQGRGGLNNNSEIPLHNNNHHHQIQMNNDNHFVVDPTCHDDFLKQIMLSNLPSSASWTLDVVDPNSDETSLSNNNNNVAFPPPHPYGGGDEHSNLASKFRNHQITDKAAALMLLNDSGSLLLHGNNNNMPPFDSSSNDVVVDPSSFKSSSGDGSVQALYNGFTAQPPSNHFQHPPPQGQNYGGSVSATNQAPASGQPRQKVRARRGQATDPHSIAERLRRERIAERMKALQELVPNANKTDKASMLDEIIDYVKFLQVQVKVLSMSRLGGAAAVAPLVADMSSEGGGDCGQTNGGVHPRNNQKTASNESLTMTEQQVAKLMEEDMGSAMQYLQGKGLCLMPISLATAISTATCHNRNPFMIAGNPVTASNGDVGPSSPAMSVSSSIVKDASSVSKS